MSRPLLDVQLPRTRQQIDSANIKRSAERMTPRSAGLQGGVAVARPAPLPKMGITSREWDNRTEFGTILLLMRAQRKFAGWSLWRTCAGTFVQRPETKPSGIDPRLVPLPAALRLLCRECAETRLVVAQLTLWQPLRTRNRAIPYCCSDLPHIRDKPGHRSRAVPGFVGVRRQARTLAGSV